MNCRRRLSRTAISAKIALLPATTLDDPTYGRVCRGLAKALTNLGRTVRVFNPRNAAGLHRFKPSVVHAHFAGHLPAATNALITRSVHEGSRLVLTFQDLDHPDHPRRTAAQTHAITVLVRSAWRVTALTPQLARAVQNAYPDARGKLSVVGNGVGPEWFTARAPGRGGIMAATRLAPYKGVDLLLWAFRGLLERVPDARLVVCGRDFADGHYQRLAARLGLLGRVRFLGQVGKHRLMRELSGSRFFVAASRTETYGMAALEAMASGCALLASRAGAAQHLAHGRQAWLVRPGDWRALERGMLRLWRDAPLRRRLAKAGRRLAATNTWEDRARRYEQAYECA